MTELREYIANRLYGRSRNDPQCVTCGELPKGFKDKLSVQEWEITRMCQECQDKLYEERE